MLLHAKARWPSVVHLSLWPYAVRMAVYIHAPHFDICSKNGSVYIQHCASSARWSITIRTIFWYQCGIQDERQSKTIMLLPAQYLPYNIAWLRAIQYPSGHQDRA
ncbi:hypothetical protein ACHAW6_006143 [Cyclotella cf. meneghiniana]